MIRPARPSDIPALSALATRTWSDAFGHALSPEDEAAELAETRSEAYFEQALETDTILVAEEDEGELAGYVQFGPVRIPEVDAGPSDQGLHRLYVDDGAQGRGLGRELLESALQHPRLAAADRIYLTVWEANERALRLYERYGFRRAGTTRFRFGDEVVEDLVLVRSR